MERAGRLIAQSKLSGCASAEEFARAAWPAAVGKRIASRTRAVSLVRARLVVEVEDAVWQRQLFTLRHQILKRIDEVFGAGVVTALEFRVAVPRRSPQRETQRVPGDAPAGIFDEADQIQNPALRILYKAARKKASA
ncbi:MAG: DciA family protein [Bryobacteraceae bacterium]